MTIVLKETKEAKACNSDDYNYVFDKTNGFFARWGKTKEDDPLYAPFPELLDIEITTICHGTGGKLCKFCYKSNTPNGKNMSFETFKTIIDKFPKYKQKTLHFYAEDVYHPEKKDLNFFVFSPNQKLSTLNKTIEAKDIKVGDTLDIKDTKKEVTKIKIVKIEEKEKEVHALTQIAFGADSHATSNPDLWKMMEYCREIGIIPNITVADIADETADKLAKYCGAVAVSLYDNKDICYDSIKKLTDRGLPVNSHVMIAEETYQNALTILQDRLTDPRLSELKAIVFLSLKQKGRGIHFTPLSQEKFNFIVNFSMDNNIGIGFDSCSCHKYLKSIKNHEKYEQFAMYAEPCESGRMSIYIDVEGKLYPCSFCEGCEKSDIVKNHTDAFKWDKGIDMLKINDFDKDVWNSTKIQAWRNFLIESANKNIDNIECPMFNV